MKGHDKIKAIYDKTPVYNIVRSGDRLRDFPFKYEIRQVFLLSPLLFTIVFNVLVKTRPEKKQKGYK